MTRINFASQFVVYELYVYSHCVSVRLCRFIYMNIDIMCKYLNDKVHWLSLYMQKGLRYELYTHIKEVGGGKFRIRKIELSFHACGGSNGFSASSFSRDYNSNAAGSDCVDMCGCVGHFMLQPA